LSIQLQFRDQIPGGKRRAHGSGWLLRGLVRPLAFTLLP
jgi:hypothetical protein